MLRHELAHVARRDHYVNLFQTIIGAVFFFHPLARYACRQLTLEREMACDDHVVGSGAEAEAYAESIIKAAERSIGAPRGAHQLALFGTRQILERRIEMILNKERRRMLAGKWKYLILPATLIAIVAWMLIPARLAKPGLAQQADGALDDLVAKYKGDSKNFDDLVETALTNPDPETRQKAVLRLYILEGAGSVAALAKLYNKSSDPMIKRLVIQSLGARGSKEQLAAIAQTEQSQEFRRMANEAIVRLDEIPVTLKFINREDFKVVDQNGKVLLVSDLMNEALGNLREVDIKEPLLSVRDKQDGLPPPPPPPPPPSDAMTVTAGQEFKPIVGNRGESVFDLLREAADASIRRDTSFFERVLDEDYRETAPNGATMNKAQAIADVKRFDYDVKKIEFDDLSVSGNDHYAFATFLGTIYFQANGKDSTVQIRYTVNFIKRDGQLKIAAIHMTQKY